MTTIRRWFLIVRPYAGVLVMIIAACGAAAGDPPSASVTTLTPGWEQKFTVDWAVEPEAGVGGQRIRGYVISRYGRFASPVRVFAQALDQSGAVVGQRVVLVPGGVPALGRSYFEVPHLPSASRYVVTVWDYSPLREP